MTIQWSEHQLAVFDAIASGGSNLLVEAVAGSGKTTTILEGLRHIRRGEATSLLAPSVVFLAFNRNIAETLKARCPASVQCATFHALGLRALKRRLDSPRTRRKEFVDGRKVGKIVFRLLDRDDPDIQNVIRLVGLLKSTWPKEKPEVLAKLHDLDFDEPQKAMEVAERAYARSMEDLDSIDFDDMLMLPIALDAEFDEQDWIFVDEAQDTNNIQLEILDRLAGSARGDSARGASRYVFVGDRHQAIYAFRGANSDSMDVIASRFATRSLPLSVSYRCPKLVIAEAQKYIK